MPGPADRARRYSPADADADADRIRMSRCGQRQPGTITTLWSGWCLVFDSEVRPSRVTCGGAPTRRLPPSGLATGQPEARGALMAARAQVSRGAPHPGRKDFAAGSRQTSDPSHGHGTAQRGGAVE